MGGWGGVGGGGGFVCSRARGGGGGEPAATSAAVLPFPLVPSFPRKSLPPVTGATLRGRAAAARARARKVLGAQEGATCEESHDSAPGPAGAIGPRYNFCPAGTTFPDGRHSRTSGIPLFAAFPGFPEMPQKVESQKSYYGGRQERWTGRRGDRTEIPEVAPRRQPKVRNCG